MGPKSGEPKIGPAKVPDPAPGLSPPDAEAPQQGALKFGRPDFWDPQKVGQLRSWADSGSASSDFPDAAFVPENIFTLQGIIFQKTGTPFFGLLRIGLLDFELRRFRMGPFSGEGFLPLKLFYPSGYYILRSEDPQNAASSDSAVHQNRAIRISSSADFVTTQNRVSPEIPCHPFPLLLTHLF